MLQRLGDTAADACVTIYRFHICYFTQVSHILNRVGINGSMLQTREQSLVQQ